MRTIIAGTILLVLSAMPADARHHRAKGFHSQPSHAHARHAHAVHRVAHYRVAPYKARRPHARVTRYARARGVYDAGTIVAHPAGCPHNIPFCGCGTAVHVFGAPIRSLWLAAAWFKYPAAQPGPGMVAVRQHHVFAILDYKDGRALAYDPNSGGGKTRIHWVSLAGYRVVNPHAKA